MVKERRLFVRFAMSGIVVVQIDPSKKDTIDCELSDLSYDGIALFSPQELKADSQIKFIVINGQLNVNIGGLGKVVYCKPVRYNDKSYFRVGIQFIEVDRAQVRTILTRVRDIL